MKPIFGHETPLNWRYQEDLYNISQRLAQYEALNMSRLFDLDMQQKQAQNDFQSYVNQKNLGLKKQQFEYDKRFANYVDAHRPSNLSVFMNEFLPGVTNAVGSYLYNKKREKYQQQQKNYYEELLNTIMPLEIFYPEQQSRKIPSSTGFPIDYNYRYKYRP